MIDRSKFRDKASRDPELVALYESEPYLRAYAAHTDRRVVDDPERAVGGKWEELGRAQLDFLIEEGLAPGDRLLDVGCGTGRFARHVVPLLGHGCYTGVDLSSRAVFYAIDLAQREGWYDHAPEFIVSDGTLTMVYGRAFEVAWAHAVFMHLPPDAVARVFSDLMRVAFEHFFFTWKPAQGSVTTRTGLKQFAHPPDLFFREAQRAGFTFENLGRRPPLRGCVGRVTR